MLSLWLLIASILSASAILVLGGTWLVAGPPPDEEKGKVKLILWFSVLTHLLTTPFVFGLW